MTGTIKLYQIRQNQSGIKLEEYYYRSEAERKRALIHWKRKYNGKLNNCYLQISPGYNLLNKKKDDYLTKS